jgi:glutamine synthetase
MLRSKTRILPMDEDCEPELSDFPEWNFDGSSTYQAPGSKSDLVLKPVRFVEDPLRGMGNYLVLCEVFEADGLPHISNTRSSLRHELDAGAAAHEPWIGFEQEYTFYQEGRPMGWPEVGFPEPQGPYYCSVGSNRAFGREVVEAHTNACLEAGLMLYGTNAEVMPAQWEFQVGYRGQEDESADPLTVCDHLWLARWLLCRVAEDFDVVVSLDQKPVKGDWNGAGMHTNFSTKAMRDTKRGWDAIMGCVDALSKHHAEHVAVYGHGLADRLTGHHETCSVNTFKMGERDRGASVRIPDSVCKDRFGYIEDRRPGANADPYEIAARILKTCAAGSAKSSAKSAAPLLA